MKTVLLETQIQQKYERVVELERIIQNTIKYLPQAYARKQNKQLCEAITKQITQQDILKSQIQILSQWINQAKGYAHGSNQ